MKRILSTCVLLCLAGVFGAVMGQTPIVFRGAPVVRACVGTTAFMYASIPTPGYNWQVSTDKGVSWTTLENGDIYSIEGNSWNFYPIYPYSSQLEFTTTLSMDGNLFRVINAADPSIFSAPILFRADTGLPPAPVFISPDTTVYEGSTVAYTVSGAGGITLDSITWLFPYGSYTYYYDIGDSVAAFHIFHVNSNPNRLTVSIQNGCGITNGYLNLTVLPLKTSPAGMPGHDPDCSINGILPGILSINPDSTGNPIAAVLPSGANPVAGSIQSCVTVDAAVSSYNGIPYVQRHYNLEPSTNAGTSTATVTLYFTQGDFDAYNLAKGSSPALPTGSADATGIANLRVTQFHGAGTNPGTYVGGSGEIDPDDNNIVWNATANRWEVTFDITGFSGFFISTGSLTPLPLTLLSFTGQSVTGGNLLQWTTSSEQNTRNFEVQRNEGNGFQDLATLPAAGNSHQNLSYSYTDPLDGSAAYSYRLKMIDIDDKFTYSKTVTMQTSLTVLSIGVSPNPFHQTVTLTVSSPKPANAVMTVKDISGKLLLQQNISLAKGANSLEPGKIAALPQGVYLLSVTTDQQKQTVKFIKE